MTTDNKPLSHSLSASEMAHALKFLLLTAPKYKQDPQRAYVVVQPQPTGRTVLVAACAEDSWAGVFLEGNWPHRLAFTRESAARLYRRLKSELGERAHHLTIVPPEERPSRTTLVLHSLDPHVDDVTLHLGEYFPAWDAATRKMPPLFPEGWVPPAVGNATAGLAPPVLLDVVKRIGASPGHLVHVTSDALRGRARYEVCDGDVTRAYLVAAPFGTAAAEQEAQQPLGEKSGSAVPASSEVPPEARDAGEPPVVPEESASEAPAPPPTEAPAAPSVPEKKRGRSPVDQLDEAGRAVVVLGVAVRLASGRLDMAELTHVDVEKQKASYEAAAESFHHALEQLTPEQRTPVLAVLKDHELATKVAEQFQAPPAPPPPPAPPGDGPSAEPPPGA